MQVVQITIKSIEKKALTRYIIFLKNILNYLNLKYSIINIPTQKKRITLLKSPHVYKKAREQFELRLYKKTIYIKSFLKNKYIVFLMLNKPKLIGMCINYIGK